VVISGGRPAIRERPVHKFLHSLHNATADPVWVVRDDDAAGYEPDGHEIVTYSRDWAEEYAAGHWCHVQPMQPGGFLGAFPGREAACREAERRGCWAVLQLDDNIDRLGFWMDYASLRLIAESRGLAYFAEIIAAVLLSTNAAMAGAQLTSVAPARREAIVARAGFCYSLFGEKVGNGRVEWQGPYEDDIMHALQYATAPGGRTAAIIPLLRYHKEYVRKTGMRAHYDGSRAAGLQRMFPETARILNKASTSNGLGDARIFHQMSPLARRAPLAVTDKGLYDVTRAEIAVVMQEVARARDAHWRDLVTRRAARAASGSLPAVR